MGGLGLTLIPWSRQAFANGGQGVAPPTGPGALPRLPPPYRGLQAAPWKPVSRAAPRLSHDWPHIPEVVGEGIFSKTQGGGGPGWGVPGGMLCIQQ